MDITLAGAGITYVPNDDQLGRVSLEFAAFDGEVGNGQLPVPDSAAAVVVAGGRLATVTEIATLLTNGYIIDQDRDRGPEPAGTARQHSFGVMDANCLLGGFVVLRSDPAQTDYARVMAWAAEYLPSAATTWVLNSGTVTMPKKHYDTDGGWSELITDVVELTGKTLFLHDKANGTGLCLHYHVLTTGHTSGLSISDNPSAVNGVTVFAPQSPVRQRTSVDLVNTVRGRDQAGRTHTSTDPTSIAAHNVDGLKHQALIDFEAVSRGDLGIKTDAVLASQKDERDTYTLAIGPLDATALSLIRVGDLIPVTSSVLGLTASAQRIAHMTLTVYQGTGVPAPGLWNAALELGAPVRRRRRGAKGKLPTIDLTPTPVFGTGENCTPIDMLSGQRATVLGMTGTQAYGFIGGGVVVHSVVANDTEYGYAQSWTPYTDPRPVDQYQRVGGVGIMRGRARFQAMAADTGEVVFISGEDDTYAIQQNGLILYRNALGGFDGTTSFLVKARLANYGPVDLLLSPFAPADILFEMLFDGSDLKAKVWASGTPEPSAYMGTALMEPLVYDLDGVMIQFTAAAPAAALDTVTTVDNLAWCVTDPAVPAAFYGIWTEPRFAATADGITATFPFPALPDGGILMAQAYVNGVAEPSTFDAIARTFTLVAIPETGDAIDVAWVPIP